MNVIHQKHLERKTVSSSQAVPSSDYDNSLLLLTTFYFPEIENQTRLPKEKVKQDFSIVYVQTTKKEDSYFEFIAKPKNGRSFSIPTEEGVFSFDQAKVVGFSKIFC